MGSFLPWKKISFICGGFNGCLLISYLLLTETPYFLLLRASEEKAKNALFRIRSKSYNVDSELQELLEFKEDNDIRRFLSILFVVCCNIVIRRNVCVCNRHKQFTDLGSTLKCLNKVLTKLFTPHLSVFWPNLFGKSISYLWLTLSDEFNCDKVGTRSALGFQIRKLCNQAIQIMRSI